MHGKDIFFELHFLLGRLQMQPQSCRCFPHKLPLVYGACMTFRVVLGSLWGTVHL
jgi:hypothetical protein